MQKYTLPLIFLLVLLISCASPQVPAQEEKTGAEVMLSRAEVVAAKINAIYTAVILSYTRGEYGQFSLSHPRANKQITARIVGSQKKGSALCYFTLVLEDGTEPEAFTACMYPNGKINILSGFHYTLDNEERES